ncbi:sugar ABC transporter ATP-binding protein [Nocardioides halotolerans]|uniref:sugar ABC transporter ATP-binding protein n=1 Tax=Nocardioides halotolerans TaxID=433660 RepID=UPI00040EAF6E|nr:sugar ABC transporter ATP-binding protein [Nocardioides halotolerans]
MTASTHSSLQGGPPPALQVDGLVKRFGDAVVLDGVSLAVEAGEVHALVGSNGSGKSTLVKLLTGVYSPTAVAGVRVGGREATLPVSRGQLRKLGVRVVHQSLALVPDLTVAENVALGTRYATGPLGTISWRRSREAVAATLDRLGLDVRPDDPVASLAAWQRVGVAVARAFHGNLGRARLILLDEVTAAMPREEVARLFDLIQRLTADDVGVLYVTHRFEEVFAIAQRATVLRDGKVAQTTPVAELSQATLVEALTGAGPQPATVRTTPATPTVPTASSALTSPPATAEVALSVAGLAARVLRGVDLEVRSGEIVGVTGRAGCGKSELGRVLFGLQQGTAGTVRYAGHDGPLTPRRLARAGVAYVPQDRRRQALLTGASTRENLSLAWLGTLGRPWWLDRRAEARAAERAVRDYRIVPGDPQQVIDTLSGGNQQKVVMSRWLTRGPRVVVLDEPTEGVDVPSRREIYDFVRTCAADGAAVLVLSSSAEEIVELCHRAVVVDEGRVVARFDGDLDVATLSHVTLEASSHV